MTFNLNLKSSYIIIFVVREKPSKAERANFQLSNWLTGRIQMGIQPASSE